MTVAFDIKVRCTYLRTFLLFIFRTLVLKSTSRGQITLPKSWRDNFDTANYLVELHDDKLIIKPLDLKGLDEEEVLFDADRDNKGKGIGIDDMMKALKKLSCDGRCP